MTTDFPIWKTIKCFAQDQKEIEERMTEHNAKKKNLCWHPIYRLSKGASEVLNKTSFDKDKEIDLVEITPGQLSSKPYDFPYEEIVEFATKMGLELCPQWVVPCLRMQYPEKGIWPHEIPDQWSEPITQKTTRLVSTEPFVSGIWKCLLCIAETNGCVMERCLIGYISRNTHTGLKFWVDEFQDWYKTDIYVPNHTKMIFVKPRKKKQQ